MINLKQDFEIKKEIARTNQSVLYMLVESEKDIDHKKDGRFVFKKYLYDKGDEGQAKRELEVARFIEENCNTSVVIPILFIAEQGGEQGLFMKFTRGGMFLTDMINILEERYGKKIFR